MITDFQKRLVTQSDEILSSVTTELTTLAAVNIRHLNLHKMTPSIQVGSRLVSVERLTQDAFAPFGTVIENPLSNRAESDTQLPRNAIYANQGSAVKVLDVTNMTEYYAEASSGVKAKAVMNMFVCSPRKLRDEQGLEQHVAVPFEAVFDPAGPRTRCLFDVKILERHPYTFQTFVPVALDKVDPSTSYLVIVAPTLEEPGPTAKPKNFLDRAKASLSSLSSEMTSSYGHNGSSSAGRKGPGPPDVANLRAFLARGNQAVTYAAGTWHAPMVVLGLKPVDFVVVQFANGVGPEDCQEMLIVPESADSDGVAVVIDAPIMNEASAARAKL